MDDWMESFIGCNESDINGLEKQEFNNCDEDESISFKDIAPRLDSELFNDKNDLKFYKSQKLLERNDENLSTEITCDYIWQPYLAENDCLAKEQVLRKEKDMKKDFILANDDSCVEASDDYYSEGFSEIKPIAFEKKFNNSQIEESDFRNEIVDKNSRSFVRNHSSNDLTNNLLIKTESLSQSIQSEPAHKDFIEVELNAFFDIGEITQEEAKTELNTKETLSIQNINTAFKEFYQEVKNILNIDLSCLKYGQSMCKSIITALFDKRKDFIVISIIRAHIRMINHAIKNELSRTVTNLDYIDFDNSEQKMLFREFQKHFERRENSFVLKKWITEKSNDEPMNAKQLINGSFCKEYFREKAVRESFFMFLDIIFKEKDFSKLSNRFKIKNDFVEKAGETGKQAYWSMRERFLRELLFLSDI